MTRTDRLGSRRREQGSRRPRTRYRRAGQQDLDVALQHRSLDHLGAGGTVNSRRSATKLDFVRASATAAQRVRSFAQGVSPSALSSALAANPSSTSFAQPLAANRNRRTASSFALSRSANSPP